MKKHTTSIFVILFLVSIKLVGQTKFNFDLFSYGGYEYNIFKSPELLYDLDFNDYLDTDSIIVSDYFMDLGYATMLKKKKKNSYNFDLGSDFLYRKYFNYPKADQKKLSLDSKFEKVFSDKFLIGIEYIFSWNDKLGTTITGEELNRSFKYFGNTGNIFMEFTPNKKVNFLLGSAYQLKSYYQTNTSMPLDHSNLDLYLDASYKPANSHKFNINLQYTIRKYQHYAASDSAGNLVVAYDNSGSLISGTDKRHFKYLVLGIDYDFKPLKGFMISPGFQYSQRSDLFQGYYNYSAISPDLKIRYKNKKWYVAASASFKSVNYENRYAYTYIPNSQSLEYNYIKYDIKVRYKLFKSFELFGNYSSNSRDSNTELEYLATRRPYNNYDILFGVNILIVDYNSKYRKKK